MIIQVFVNFIPGDSILDVFGGPGSYTVHYAKKRCDITLVDLSEKTVGYPYRS